MAKDKGYILLYRSIQDHDIWKAEPFTKAQAWIDLLLMASYKDKSLILGNKQIISGRGTIITSEVHLADRWKWTRKRVRAFLRLLESLNMIEKKSVYKGTALLIKNYEKYQSNGTAEDTAEGTAESLINKGIELFEGTAEGTAKGTLKGTAEGTAEGTHTNKYKIKNNKRVNKERESVRHKYGEYNNVLLSDEELTKLKSEYPELWSQKLEALSEYLMTHNKKYKSHYATIKAWIRKDQKGGNNDGLSEEDRGEFFDINKYMS